MQYSLIMEEHSNALSLSKITIHYQIILFIKHHVAVLFSCWNILQGNGYSFSAKAGSYFIVHSRVLFSFTRMTKTSYSPVLHASAGNLRVTSQNVKGKTPYPFPRCYHNLKAKKEKRGMLMIASMGVF